MVKVENLVKRYGTNYALSDVSFEIGEGEIVGLLGPNGAGKSTAMNIITGYLSSTSGGAFVNGIDILENPIEAKKYIGFLPEQPPLYPEMTVLEYLNFVYELKGTDLPREEHISEIISVAKLTEVKNRLIKNLSKGYKQRVGIAQALVGDPKVIIFDEPTVGLDPKQIADIRELITRLGESKTVILSSHILAEIQAVCDRVMIINGGRLIAFDTLENIRKENSPENRFSLTVKGSEAQVSTMLSQFTDILSFDLTSDGNTVSAFLEAKPDCDIREELFYAFAKRSIPLLELKKVTPSLEEIFLSLTSSAYSDEEYEEEYEEDDGGGYDDEDYDDDDDDDEYEEDDDDDDGYVPLFSSGNGGK